MSAKGIFSSPEAGICEEHYNRTAVASLTSANSWIGVDLDGTLAEYTPGRELAEIGEPIELMVSRVKKWISQGNVVKIFTARASMPQQVQLVKDWLAKHGLPDLEVTNVKDFGMVELWDDRCVQVNANTGCPTIETNRSKVRAKISRQRSRGRSGTKLVSKLLISFGRLTSTWNQVPQQEFQPAALGRTK